MLERLGLTDLEVHIWLDGFSDYRFKSLKEKLDKAREFTVDLPIEVPASLIQEGQFAVGHVYYEWRTTHLFGGFTRLVSIRDARDALASMMHFEFRRLNADPLRSPGQRAWIDEPSDVARMIAFLETMGAQLINDYVRIKPWCDDPQAVVVRFEQLMGDYGRDHQYAAIRSIANALELRYPLDPKGVLEGSLFKDTLTYSGARTRYQEIWTNDIERVFRKLGGVEANTAMGYSSRPT